MPCIVYGRKALCVTDELVNCIPSNLAYSLGYKGSLDFASATAETSE
jgi:hypothetical protein